MNAETELLHAELKMCRDISSKRHAEVLQLRADLARVTAELEHHKSVKETIDSAHKELSREHAAIRARVAELERERDGVKELMRHRLHGHDLMTIQRNEARDERDGLKQRNDELVEALRGALGWLEKGGVRSAHVALANAIARAESAAQEASK